MNYWAMALPSLIYVASIGARSIHSHVNGTQPANFTGTGAGIASIYLDSVFETSAASTITCITSSYYATCLALNILLTLMIITKLILHRKNLQRAIGTSNAATRVYTTIVIMLVESYALYAIALISDTLAWALQSVGVYVTGKILSNVQVRTVFHFPNAQV